MSPSKTTRATLLLFFLFFIGFGVTLLAVIDLQWTHRVLVKESIWRHTSKTSLHQKSR